MANEKKLNCLVRDVNNITFYITRITEVLVVIAKEIKKLKTEVETLKSKA